MKGFASSAVVILFYFCVLVFAQLPEDDEVLAGFPNYTHPIYSGTNQVIPRLS